MIIQTMTFNWLMLAHFKNPAERDGCFKHLDGTRVEPGVTVYVAMFGPYITSPVHLAMVTKDGAEYMGIMRSSVQGKGYYNKYVPKVKKLVQTFLDNKIKIHGVDFYGHSAGLLLGGYYNLKYFLTAPDLTEHVLRPLQPKVVTFDSCYMGVISALYEMSDVKSIQYVLASPTYHPSYSLLESEAFGKIGTGSHDKATLAKQLKAVTCSFQELTRPAYRCFILIDLQKIPKLVKKLSKLTVDDFNFTNSTMLSKADKVTHDIYKSVKHPEIKKLVKEISKDTCGLKHCKVARGISIETEFPDAHRGLYKSMKWYKQMKAFYGE